MSPWGTLLTCEENFHRYFDGDRDKLSEGIKAIHQRYGVPGKSDGWGYHHDRFDVNKEPNEPNRFGWVVEIDPYDPNFKPVKRTALGRFKHEAATVVIAKDGRAVIYSGDDERFEYIYKFITKGKFDPSNREANRNLLDEGTLYVARFHPNGSGAWMPLVHGMGPLTEKNGFKSQADVLINTRRAADLLGATKMDRPEDIETNPVTGKVYHIMTNNSRRVETDAANPRPYSRHGHIIEMIENNTDPLSTTFSWNVFILCGDPKVPEDGAFYQGKTDVSYFSCPDNITFDNKGRMWVATDGMPKSKKLNDGVFMVDTEGKDRGMSRMFLSGPVDCEICGPEFTPDNKTFFVAIQHPGEGSSYDNPSSRWPDFRGDMPPRPAVVAIYRKDGKEVGS